MKEKILVVDDEEGIVEFIEINLRREGFEVFKAYSGQEAIKIVKQQSPDLILLDIMLPDKNGFEVCRELREFTSVPIIMVTAKGEDIDKIVGLETGADDYVVKPFNPRELLARIKAILRRLSYKAADSGAKQIEVGKLSMDIYKRKVLYKGKNVDLAPKEFDLLFLLASNHGKVFSRKSILEEVWGSEFLDERTVDVYITHIREKLKSCNAIQTVWGKGYKYAKAEDDET